MAYSYGGYANQYHQGTERLKGFAEGANKGYVDKASEFDAGKNLNDWATGAWNQTSRRLADSLGSLRGSQVGMGRINTGFATRDEDRLVRDTTNDFQDKLLMQSMGAAQLQASSNAQLGSYGAQMAGLHMDAVSGGADRATDEVNRRRQRKSGLAGALGTAIGAGVGSFVPGVGTAVGAGIGGNVFGSIFG